MKNLIITTILSIGVSFASLAQDNMMKDNMMKGTSVISLEQTPGEFTQKSITVNKGTYVFEISNNNVDHNVGFVLVKKGLDVSDASNHIQTAYVTEPVGTNDTKTSKPTKLEPGEYVYFCPLNPTGIENYLVVK